jgi:hypothetical protein
MATDRVASLRAAAARKRELATSRARTALRELDQRGAEITFQSVARHAGVSRQWLYEQPDLRHEIDRLRAATRGRPPGIQNAERASEASLRPSDAHRREPAAARGEPSSQDRTGARLRRATRRGYRSRPVTQGAGRPSHAVGTSPNQESRSYCRSGNEAGARARRACRQSSDSDEGMADGSVEVPNGSACMGSFDRLRSGSSCAAPTERSPGARPRRREPRNGCRDAWHDQQRAAL